MCVCSDCDSKDLYLQHKEITNDLFSSPQIFIILLSEIKLQFLLSDKVKGRSQSLLLLQLKEM